MMLAKDGTDNKSVLGANAILGVSLALAKVTPCTCACARVCRGGCMRGGDVMRGWVGPPMKGFRVTCTHTHTHMFGDPRLAPRPRACRSMPTLLSWPATTNHSSCLPRASTSSTVCACDVEFACVRVSLCTCTSTRPKSALSHLMDEHGCMVIRLRATRTPPSSVVSPPCGGWSGWRCRGQTHSFCTRKFLLEIHTICLSFQLSCPPVFPTVCRVCVHVHIYSQSHNHTLNQPADRSINQ